MQPLIQLKKILHGFTPAATMDGSAHVNTFGTPTPCQDVSVKVEFNEN